MYSKVLLAYDGSESGRRALLECADINNLLHAEIHLLAVAPIAATLFVAKASLPTCRRKRKTIASPKCSGKVWPTRRARRARRRSSGHR
jgi:nucleotide-binding universal stress UspA family protein